MNNYTPNGQVLSAAISVLPATVGTVIVPSLQLQQAAVAVLAFAGLWAVSYVGTSLVMRMVKR